MTFFVDQEACALISPARGVLGMTQRALAQAIGSSLRTVSRWETAQSIPDPSSLGRLAALLYPKDTALAAEAAEAAGTTLEKLGIVAPPAPSPVAVQGASRPHARVLSDAVVYAAAEALERAEGTLGGARAAVHAAFARAIALGMTLEEVASATAATPAPTHTPAPAPAAIAAPPPKTR
jgi:transcriptional regulator with XRE-family HTH domain